MTLVNIGMYCQQSLALNAKTTQERVRRADEINMATGLAATDATLTSASSSAASIIAAAAARSLDIPAQRIETLSPYR